MGNLNKKEKLIEYIYILVGTGLMALSSNLFFTPAGMVPGGFTGIAIIIEHVTVGAIPVWLGNVILNVPLIILAILIRGWFFMRRTFIGAVAFTLWLYVIPEYGLAAENFFITSVVGGAIMGVGLGMTFLGKATTGGTDTIAALVQKFKPHMSTASLFPIMDAAVIAFSAWIFGIESSLYAAISVVITFVAAEKIMSGFMNSILAYIVSNEYDKVAEAVLKNLDRGATFLEGRGAYTGNEKNVILVAISKKEIAVLKDTVSEIDPAAFMILTDAKEVRGDGFLRFNKDEL